MTHSKFKEPDYRALRRWIIEKFLRKGILCRYAIDIVDVRKGIDPRYHKQIKKVLKDMIRAGEIVRFPHGTKIKVCLNKKRRRDFELEITRLEY